MYLQLKYFREFGRSAKSVLCITTVRGRTQVALTSTPLNISQHHLTPQLGNSYSEQSY